MDHQQYLMEFLTKGEQPEEEKHGNYKPLHKINEIH